MILLKMLSFSHITTEAGNTLLASRGELIEEVSPSIQMVSLLLKADHRRLSPLKSTKSCSTKSSDRIVIFVKVWHSRIFDFGIKRISTNYTCNPIDIKESDSDLKRSEG